jgi:hypothetical protein
LNVVISSVDTFLLSRLCPIVPSIAGIRAIPLIFITAQHVNLLGAQRRLTGQQENVSAPRDILDRLLTI